MATDRSSAPAHPDAVATRACTGSFRTLSLCLTLLPNLLPLVERSFAQMSRSWVIPTQCCRGPTSGYQNALGVLWGIMHRIMLGSKSQLAKAEKETQNRWHVCRHSRSADCPIKNNALDRRQQRALLVLRDVWHLLGGVVSPVFFPIWFLALQPQQHDQPALT